MFDLIGGHYTMFRYCFHLDLNFQNTIISLIVVQYLAKWMKVQNKIYRINHLNHHIDIYHYLKLQNYHRFQVVGVLF